MGFLTDIKENKKDRILFIFQQWKKKYIKINGARNYQMRKTTIRKWEKLKMNLLWKSFYFGEC